MAELAEQFELHPNQIIQFRQHAVENMAGLLKGQKRLNPATKKPFVLGDEVTTGRFFVSYDLRLVLKDGFFYE